MYWLLQTDFVDIVWWSSSSSVIVQRYNALLYVKSFLAASDNPDM